MNETMNRHETNVKLSWQVFYHKAYQRLLKDVFGSW